jgi:hypothetical protein
MNRDPDTLCIYILNLWSWRGVGHVLRLILLAMGEVRSFIFSIVSSLRYLLYILQTSESLSDH